MAMFSRTRAVADKLLRDIRSTVFWVSLIVQVVFLAYYGWSIYSNIKNLPFLIIYSVLALISVVAFINFLVTHKHKEKKNRVFNRILRITKYIANGVMLAVNVYEMIKYSGSDIEIILLAISAIFWLANIILEIVRIAVEKYFDLFKVALKEDFSILEKLNKAKDVKGSFFQFLDAPIEAIVNKIEKKDPKPTPTKTELAVAQLTKEYEETNAAATKQRSADRAAYEKKQLKEHVQTIFNHIFKPKKKK